jgi:hypothetical protein
LLEMAIELYQLLPSPSAVNPMKTSLSNGV